MKANLIIHIYNSSVTTGLPALAIFIQIDNEKGNVTIPSVETTNDIFASVVLITYQ